MKKILLVIGIIICSFVLLSGCTDRGNLVSNSITGTIEKVELKDDKVKITFSGDSYGIITATNVDSDGTNWFNILKSHEGKKIKLTWIGNYNEIVIAYIEFV